METAKIKLHIQMEPYNGKKFDFMEVEVSSISQIEKVYDALKNEYGNTKPYQPANKASEVPKNEEYATYSNGKPVETKDKVKLSREEYKKAMDSKVMPWTATYEMIKELEAK